MRALLPKEATMTRKAAGPGRRGFLQGFLAAAGLAAAPAAVAQPQGRPGPADWLPAHARLRTCRSLKQSSHDPSGGNRDYWPIKAGATQELFNQQGPGAITHIWFTISAQSPTHLKELVLRAYWDGNARPSIETPVGD